MRKTKTENELALHNELITNNLNLDLYQARIVAFLATSIFKTDTDFKVIKTNVNELLEITKLKSGEHYTELRETLNALRKKDVRIRGKDFLLETGFLSSAKYFDNGEIELRFDDNLKPYYLELGGNFTTFQLEILLQFSSFYALKIYELSKMILGKHKGFLEIDLQELRELLKINDKKYKEYNNFKQRVLDIALEKINNNNTDIFIEIEPTTKRNIRTLAFTVKKNYSFINKNLAIENKFEEKIKTTKKADEIIMKKQLKKEKEEEEKERAIAEKAKIENEKALEIFNKMTNEEKEQYRVDYNNLIDSVRRGVFNNLYDNYVLSRIILENYTHSFF